MYFLAENIHKTFDGVTISLSLKAQKGTMTCILGPSGSGKSTVLNIISGLVQNDAEFPLSIVLDGKKIDSLPPSKRGIGFVFQSGALFNHLSVVENVAYGLISQGTKRREAKKIASDYLRNFGLSGFENRQPQTLSGGERQRVALARTLITNPSLVLLDEPFSALDTDLRKNLSSLLRVWQKQLGFTAIMVTHDEEEAHTVSDNIIRMKI